MECTKKIEACGLTTYRCNFCQRALDDEASMRDHVARTHCVVRLRVKTVGGRWLGDKKRHHREFPAWTRTTATDKILQNWLGEARKDCAVSPREVTLPVVCVMREDANEIHYYCVLCGHETDPTLEIQQSHFFEKHVEFDVQLSRTRLFYC